MNALNVSARRSSSRKESPRTQNPDFENGWHGGPPITKSISPGLTHAVSRISWADVAKMLRSMTAQRGRLFRSVSQQSWFTSTMALATTQRRRREVADPSGVC